MAWSARPHYSSPWWTAVLLVGSASASAGIWQLAAGRPRAAGMALVASAFTLPTGVAVGFNAVLILFSVPLLLLGSGNGKPW